MPVKAQNVLVTNDNDSGPDSLRAAAASGSDIELNIGASATIELTSGPLTLGTGPNLFLLYFHPVTIEGDDIELNFTDYLRLFNHSGSPAAFTIRSDITGTGGLHVSHDSEDVILVLEGNNEFTSGNGYTFLIGSGDTLSINSDAALGSGNVRLYENAVLRVTGNTTIDNTIVLGEDGATVETDANVTISSSIDSGVSAPLTKRGTGMLTLSGDNSHGSMTISAGTLRVVGGNALSDDGEVAIAAGATLDLNDSSEAIGSLSGAGNITLGSGTLTVTQAANGTLSGAISGSGSLVKNGSSTLTLSGTNTFTGTTSVDAGTLEVSGSLAGHVEVANGATLNLSGTLDGTLAIADGATISGAGTINGDVFLLDGATLGAGVTHNGTVITVAPDITSATTASGSYRSAFTYTISADNSPTSFAISVGTLPSGLSLDTNTGAITGSPTDSGVFDVTVQATSPVGSDTQALQITLARATVTAAVTIADKFSDGGTDAAISSRALSGVLGGDDVQLVGGSAMFVDAGTGSGKTVTVRGLSLDGADAEHYRLAATSITTSGNIIDGHTLSYAAGQGGSLNGETQQVVADGASGTAVMAVADKGFAFVQWSDGASANPRSDLNVTASLAVTAQFTPLRIDGALTDVDLHDTTIGPGGSVDGGTIRGRVDSEGTILNVRLFPGGEIHGGTVGGRIIGTAGSPGFVDAFVRADAILEYIRLGPNAVIDPAARLGIGVCFVSAANIPPGIALSGLFVTSAADSALVLDRSAVCDGPSLLTAVGRLGSADQDASGRLRVSGPQGRVALWPVSVEQADATELPGYTLDADGNLRLVLDTRIAIVAWPALQEEGATGDALHQLRMELQGADGNGNLVLQPWNGPMDPAPPLYFARPGFLAAPVSTDIAEGLHMLPQGLLPPIALLVFRDAAGVLLGQALLPAPSDWPALRAVLRELPGMDAVRIDAVGVIHVEHEGAVLRGRMDYRVARGAVPQSGQLELQPAGDVNGDGREDFSVTYADGARQLLYLYPANAN